MKRNIAILASGNGSNAENMFNRFRNSELIKIKMVITNNPLAGVINRAKKHGIPVFILSNAEFAEEKRILNTLIKNEIQFIVLAGFLRKITSQIIQTYQGRIINIHPSLLPDYGGKGMYGNQVHRSVLAAREKVSGITIHLVTEEYDEGRILEQHKCEVKPDDTEETLASRIHELEYRHFPDAVEKYISNFVSR